MHHILILEDEKVIRSALRRLLERNGYEVSEAGSVEQARDSYNLSGFDLILADLRLPGVPGTEIIELSQGVPVLIMTSYASVRSAVESIKQGAVDYIAKPFDHDELLILIKRVLSERRMERQNRALKSDLARNYPSDGMVGQSPSVEEVRRRIEKVAPTDTTVLIVGESGTGKELVARAIHDQSTRAAEPFVAVNCAAIPESLIEPELFGYEKGAFTGAMERRDGLVEAANHGTLFLDEIAELPQSAQASLLRVLQDGEIRRIGATEPCMVDVRLLSATHQELKKLVATNRFRGDLFFRLRVMEVFLPPLRERGADVIELARFLVEKTCKRLNRQTLKLPRLTLDAIKGYGWPGNIRELENAIERAVILADSNEVTVENLAIDDSGTETAAVNGVADLSMDEYFQHFVRENQSGMTETELAKRLGISRKALWERRQRLGIPRQRKST